MRYFFSMGLVVDLRRLMKECKFSTSQGEELLKFFLPCNKTNNICLNFFPQKNYIKEM